MRIGHLTPRINGIGTLGILISPAQLVQQDLQSYMVNIDYAVQQGMAVSPSQLAAILTQEVNAVCMNWPDQCGDVSSVISSAVNQYAAALAIAQDKAYQGAVNNTIALPLPPSYYPPVYTVQTIPSNQNPNALDTAAPTQTNVNPTTQQNVLNPPQQSTPPSGTNDGTFTANTGMNFNEEFDIAGMQIPLWGLIAGGVGVLFLLTAMKGN